MKQHRFRILGPLSLICLCGFVRADVFEFTSTLSGAAESPPNASPGTGSADVEYDNVAHTLRVQVTFADLIGTTTAAHIHAATAVPLAGTAMVATTVPTFAGFPLNVTSGTYDNTLDLTLASSFNPAFVTAHGGIVAGAESALVDGLFAEESYLNIHTTFRPGGEIRGFLTRVPDSSGTASLLGLSLCAILGFARHRRSPDV